MNPKGKEDRSAMEEDAEILEENGEAVAAAEEGASAAAQEAPQERKGSLAEENKGLLDQLLRIKAEFENYRKRVDREKPALIRHGREEVLSRLLPLYDTLLSAHEQVVRHNDEGRTAGEIVRGLELTFQEFTKFFQTEGIERMEAVGRPYDVDKHEVLGQVATDDFEEGTVVEVLQRGYLLQGRTLRTAKVRIAKKKGSL